MDDEPQTVGVVRADHVLYATLGGVAIGALILFGDLPVWDDADRDRAGDGAFGLWAAAIGAQTVAWVLAFPLIRDVSRRWHTPEVARSPEVVGATVALAAIGLLVAALPPLLGELPETIPHRPIKVFVLNATAFGLAVFAARALWFAAAQLRAGAASPADAGAMERHRRLRADCQLVLRILGALVTLAVVASAALRAFTEEVDAENALPAQSVVVYGLLLSLLLGLVYAPAHVAMLASGRALRDKAAPLLPPGDAGFADRLDLRDRLSSFLGLDVPATTSLRTAIAVLAPLLGSFTSFLPTLD